MRIYWAFIFYIYSRKDRYAIENKKNMRYSYRLIIIYFFAAIIMENFSLFYSNEEDALLSYADIRNFQNTWNVVDVHQKGVIPVKKVNILKFPRFQVPFTSYLINIICKCKSFRRCMEVCYSITQKRLKGFVVKTLYSSFLRSRFHYSRIINPIPIFMAKNSLSRI